MYMTSNDGRKVQKAGMPLLMNAAILYIYIYIYIAGICIGKHYECLICQMNTCLCSYIIPC